MTPINGIVKNGKIEIPASAGLAEGDVVRVWLEPLSHNREDIPMDDNEIRRTLDAMDRVEPLNMTEEEYHEWRKCIAEQRAFDNSTAEERLAKLLIGWK